MKRRGFLSLVATALLVLLGAVPFDLLPARAGAREQAASTALKKKQALLQRQLQALRPKGCYILIDTAANRLYLRKGEQVLLDAVCSTGSGRRLVAENKSWTFETPRGEFRILNKIGNPVWRKPDWAFLEEGKSVPDRESERFEEGVLGEYALGFGNGYFIHGTLYNRLLGKNVTHGCVRLGSKDLLYLTRSVPLGTKLYIY